MPVAEQNVSSTAYVLENSSTNVSSITHTQKCTDLYHHDNKSENN